MSPVSISRLTFITLLVFGLASADAQEKEVRFNRDIRPILTDKCFACHGPDAKTVEGDLRLDLREVATKTDGAIVPGDSKASELTRRILSTDEDELMPPPDLHKPLTAKEKELLQKWIDAGAEYERHWAYTELTSPDLPDGAGKPIDRFIEAKLAKSHFTPVPEADRIILIRRLSFDLTGLPPTISEVEAFVNDSSEDAYEKLVDRLLDSPRFGERMAIYWLDLVRYADTVGYHGDQDISQSPYRDYVINAFNNNMPYDRFVREQLAGDLLTDPSTDQLVASGYNRLNQTTEEGGAQPKEYLAIYFADRVRNVSQVFMGATMGCAQCHDHKYDPYTMRDFYSLGAFFADLEEKGKYDARVRPPEIRVPSEELKKQIETADGSLQKLQTGLEDVKKQLLPGQAEWEKTIRSVIEERSAKTYPWVDDQQDTGGASSGDWNFVTADQHPVHDGKKSRRQTSDGLVQHYFMGANKSVVVEEDTTFYAWVYLDPKNPPKAIMLQFNDGSWEHRKVWGSDDIVYGLREESWEGYRRAGQLPKTGEWIKLEVIPSEIGLKVDSKINGMAFTQFGGLAYWDQAGWMSNEKLPEMVDQALTIQLENRSEEQKKAVQDYFLNTSSLVIEKKDEIRKAKDHRDQLVNSAPTTVVSKSVEPRVIRILSRGSWMDDTGEIVSPAIPAFLGKLETGDQRATRLDLANWLCQPDNPLTSRTMVNRLWYLMFGRGICSSVDDLGGQGAFPTHPELLDWLSVEFVKSGWDVKQMIRLIVNSDAYRRSSKPTNELRQTDPYNEYFARQGRFRIDAEMVRDGALEISGLLVEKTGGRSVKPYQPEGYYAQLNFPRRVYTADKGESQYRRGVYTHWQRTFLHPMLKAFDAPSREECSAFRARSNTPLQALTLLNDPTFVEAARAFAERILSEGGDSTEDRLSWAYQATVSRVPEKEISEELTKVLTKHHQYYQQNRSEAEKLVHTGYSTVPSNLDVAELAAWTSVARILLNMNETITRY